ncbi:MAG: 2-amino-4-hydroxy-6-hydroxymethyldihydropteridine diphosphokinase [Nitrososphaerota archaeon]|jgi:dihydroneopterin aldolase/2-amino-4-hydroxy-6-hydroxymethyldihydropteridine diphosphokinase|nr:2-amino-4-hydroxy-6-hydroxymethyldihydropteridine diphosphokinase [Nitrososphaerota archaeon]
MDKILIEGVKVWGTHGVLESERNSPQQFTVNMEIWVDNEKSYFSDNLQDTVNYADIYDIIKTVIETQSFMLIERLSYVIIEKTFSYDARILNIKLQVMKNKPPLNGQIAYTGVEIEKNRNDISTQNSDTKPNIKTTPNTDTDTTTDMNINEGYKAVLAFGSNIGNRKQNIQKTIETLSNTANITVLNKSKLYETAPVGYVEQEKFYNAAILVKTTLNPFELLLKINDIENTLGRKKTFKWGPRIIDIDIIAYEGCLINTHELTLPHKEYTQRIFVLKPLSDIPDALDVTGLNTEIIKKIAYSTDDASSDIKCIGPL